MSMIRYPASGLLAPGTPMSKQRNDQGSDRVIPWDGIWQAAGDGICVRVGSDARFPNGFGPAFPLVSFDNGPYAVTDPNTGMRAVFYFGHCTTQVRVGQRFKFGDPIARADQGHPFSIGIFPPNPPGNGGWSEIGCQLANGRLGPNDPSGHWFDHLLDSDLVLWDGYLRVGDSGWRVWQATYWLSVCGYLPKWQGKFDNKVGLAVVAFQKKHNIRPFNGVIGGRVNWALKRAAAVCKQTGKKEA